MKGPLLLIAASLVGCSEQPDDGYSHGELDQIKFALSEYASNRHCWHTSCGIDQPVLVGSTELLVAYNAGELATLPVLHAASSDPSVLEVTERPCCRTPTGGFSCGVDYAACFAAGGEVGNKMYIDVEAVGEGSAHVVLYTGGGDLYDHTIIEARRGSSLELRVVDGLALGPPYDADEAVVTSLALAGQHTTVRAVARDAGGNELFATRGIDMSLRGTSASFYGRRITTLEQPYTSTRAQVWAEGRGTDELVLRAGNLTVSIPVSSD